jgi:guanine deaminase
VLLPGFIDTHIHFPQFPFTGAGIDKPLMGQEGFLTSYAFPTEESMAELGTARAVYGMAMETLLSHGTTTALIFASIHSESSKALVDLALQKQGPRAMVGKVCVDRHCPDSYIETTEASLILAEKCQKVLRVLTCFDFDVSGIFRGGLLLKHDDR